MTARHALATSAYHLDDAVENLTFARFDWAFEEAWRGIAHALDAFSSDPGGELGLAPKGAIPAAGSLRAILAISAAPAGADELIARLEGLRESLGPAEAHADELAASAALVEGVVFDSASFLLTCATTLGLVDGGPGHGFVAASANVANEDADAPSGTHGRLRRRDALKLLAAGSMLTLAACARPGRPAEPADGSAEATPALAVPPATIRATTALEGLNWPTSDPFLFCAHHVDDYPAGNDVLGPAASLEGRVLGRDFEGRDNWRMYHGEAIPGFPRHPHRGFETVTVVRTGLLDHADSMGATARYGGGDVQWLTAGGGIQHAEMFPLLRPDAGNPLELFQIWLNLPARDKMVTPYFTMLWSEQIPHVVVRDDQGRAVELTIAAGSYGEHSPPPPPPSSWASRDESDLAIWSLRLDPGATFELPPAGVGTERSLYVHRGGGVRIGGVDVANLTRVELEGAGAIGLEAGTTEVEILLLQARPIGEPVARRGPFVMNTQDEIRQAYADYQQTGFGGWPWPDDAPVHDRTRGRFARTPDGRLLEPT
jgi:redox-sensitive bicupin YhaK (pirin superfamily)